MRAKHPRVRWVLPDKLHLTLVFLGPTQPSRVVAIAAAVAEVAERYAAFPVATGEAGGRLGGRGGVAWFGLAEGAQEVARLALDLDHAIGSGAYDARRTPRPHLTVARGVGEGTLADLRAAAPDVRLDWSLDRSTLFRSQTEPGGSRYEELASAEHAGRASGAHSRP